MITAQDGGKVVNLTHRPPLHILIRKIDGTDQFRDSAVDERMVLKWILKKQGARL